MNKINLLPIVVVLTIFISLFLTFFLITVKTKHKTSNRLFAFFILLFAVDISGNLLNNTAGIPSNFGMIRNLVAFLQIPTFYLYVLSVCYSDFKLRPKHLIHIAPFIVANLVLFPRFYFVNINSKISFFENHRNMFELQFNHILFHIQIVVYIIAIFMLINKTKKLFLENYTSANIKSYNWLFQLTIALTILYSIALLKNIVKFSNYENISEWIQIGLTLFQLPIISWYLYKALNNPTLFRNINSKLKLVENILSEEKKSNPLSTIEIDYSEELAKLKAYMVREKPFLDPLLTIQNLSDEIEIPVKNLSLLINHKLGQHFFDFINTYRIENAMVILKNPAKNKVTILEILYEVGFNSKSSFNTAFKKHTGMTPTLYRKSL